MQQREYGLALVYGILGLVGLIVGLSYPLGTFSRMGPGFLPVAVSIIILGFSAVSVVRALTNGERLLPKVEPTAWPQAKSIVLLVLAIVLFAMTCRPLGLFPAVLLLMFTGAMASVQFKLEPKALIGLFVFAFSFSYFFTKMLGVPLPLIRLPF